MDKSKIKNFVAQRSGEQFPAFRSLSANECSSLRARIAGVLRCDSEEGVDLLASLASKNWRVIAQVPECREFNISDLLSARGIERVEGDVLLNWRHFDDVDELKMADLCRYFDDVWYPSVDDVEIFDSKMKWFIRVDHSGAVWLLLCAVDS